MPLKLYLFVVLYWAIYVILAGMVGIGAAMLLKTLLWKWGLA